MQLVVLAKKEAELGKFVTQLKNTTIKAIGDVKASAGRAGAVNDKDAVVYKGFKFMHGLCLLFSNILLATLQTAGVDFYCIATDQYVTVFINKEYLTSEHIAPIRMFLEARLRKLNADENPKQIKANLKLAYFVMYQNAFVGKAYRDLPMLHDNTNVRKIKGIVDNLQEHLSA